MNILEQLMVRATDDPSVRGVILTGSHARGLATEHSDYDVTVVIDEPRPPSGESPRSGEPWERERGSTLDLVALTTEQLADTSVLWQRYAYRGARVLLDRGGIGRLVERQATPTDDEAREWAREYLDGYVNQLYRAVKSRRDGHPGAALLDEQESVGWLLATVFALHGRVRPYNKYLGWELTTYPLPGVWNELLAVDNIAHHPVELFPAVEHLARANGHGDLLDGWGTDIELIRAAAR
ncbi:nucleotidyltransferase domain-containing protein [Actinoplanes bogorensis]|uniref:Nucleotidyltransferase domain-containing protein n=1 Tax=Paractinoplanes bogorensis TaxID=1610840 RepID=A0ABS5YQV9_9ACTN|nr:nucleotidyltransferase domain-containing protein [Actinoplanes bogorensis]MBU2665104.1 nucleotidyltransferase domain-containing protein [Actinoplanes bogorensis]